jgi:hypothetical protein
MRGGEVLCGIVSGKLWEQHTDGSGACGKSIAQRSGSRVKSAAEFFKLSCQYGIENI